MRGVVGAGPGDDGGPVARPRSTTARISSDFSASVVVGPSPVVPLTTSPSLPRSTRWVASSSARARSSRPSASKGVTIAVSTRPNGRPGLRGPAGVGLMGRRYPRAQREPHSLQHRGESPSAPRRRPGSPCSSTRTASRPNACSTSSPGSPTTVTTPGPGLHHVLLPGRARQHHADRAAPQQHAHPPRARPELARRAPRRARAAPSRARRAGRPRGGRRTPRRCRPRRRCPTRNGDHAGGPPRSWTASGHGRSW